MRTILTKSRSSALELLVVQFLRNEACCSLCDEDFETMRSLPDAIRISSRSITISNKRHSHQRRVRAEVLNALEQSLLADVTAFDGLGTFDALHDLVTRHCDGIQGAGPLLAYDVSERMGTGWFRLLPEEVYLHAGAAEGAKHLGISGSKRPLSDFPVELQCLTADQVETFLCVMKDRLAHLRD